MKVSAVKPLIVANLCTYAVQSATSSATIRYFALWPLQTISGRSYFHSWQLLSYSFLHTTGGIRALPHLLVNMLGVWLFGRPIERVVGAGRFLVCYLAAVLTAGITHLLLAPLVGMPPQPIIGASGGVFGLLLVYACLFPRHTPLRLPYLPIQAWMLALMYGGLELVTAVTRTFTGDPHFAHLGGMVGGFLILMQWRWARSRR